LESWSVGENRLTPFLQYSTTPTPRVQTTMSKNVMRLTLCAMLLALCFSVEAQQPKKVLRIGYLSSFDPATWSTRAEAIRLALRERGYIEGQNIAAEYRYAEGRLDRFGELAAELVRLKVDLIVVAGGGRTIRAAKDTTKTIPIVMVGLGIDPVKAGLIDSLARPGGNVTGLTLLATELDGKRLELLKEAVPKLAHLAVLYDPAIPAAVRQVKEDLPAAARALGSTVRSWEVGTADDFDRVFAAMGKQRPDGLYVLGGGLMNANQKRTSDFALKSRLPSAYNSREAVETGGFMYYGADEAESYRRVAYYVDKIQSQARRSAGGAADEVRVHHQSENRQADRPDDSTECSGKSRQGDSMRP